MEKKKAAAAAVASVIAASGAAVEASVDDPADLLQQTSVDPKVEYVVDDSDQDAAADEEKKEQKAKSAREAFGDWLLGLPYAVRVLFVFPQWIVGTLVMGAGDLLFTALSPLAHWFLSFLLMVLVIGAAFVVTTKAIFPDLPLKKILNRRTIKGILIASVLAFAADLLLGIFWSNYSSYKMLVIAGLILIALSSLVIWFSRRENRRRREEKETAEAGGIQQSDELVYSSLGQTFVVRPRTESKAPERDQLS